MSIESQKISVYGLNIGMYVTKLDKPWANTSYPIEGFYIKEADEIRKLKLICRNVYIDVEKSKASYKHPQRTQRDLEKEQANGKNIAPKRVLGILSPKSYKNVVPMKKVLRKAIKNHQQLHHSVNYLFSHFTNNNLNNVDQIREVISSTVESMIDNPDALMWVARTRENDDYTYNFILRQTIWSIATARQLGMNKADMERLALASILSGIGKSKLPKKLLQNESQLNATQFSLYQKHVNYTIKILENMKNIQPQIIHIVQNHCEYIDGSGYPNKVKGSEIYLASQIISLAAFYELNSSPRDISKALSPNQTLDIINKNKGKKFSTELVESFVQAIGIYPTGTLVELDNGEVAVIIETKSKQQQNFRLRPDIMILRDSSDEKNDQHKVVQLSSTTNKLKIIQSLPVGTQGIDLTEINNAVFKYNHIWDLKRVIGM